MSSIFLKVKTPLSITAKLVPISKLLLEIMKYVFPREGCPQDIKRTVSRDKVFYTFHSRVVLG